MRKLIALAVCCVCYFIGSAQDTAPPAADTTIHSDSAMIEEIKENVLDNIPVISLDDNDLTDVNSQNISSVLTAGRDPFFSAASFNFSAARFRIRGYDADMNSVYMNGVPMDNLDNGFTPFGLWGGLNDVMRNRDVSLGLRYSTFAFGDIGSTVHIDARAGKQRKQTSISYAYSNRSYDHRLMITHGTGMSKKGWAFAFSGSRRYAAEGYVPGTYYNGWSYYAAVDKRLGQKNLLSLIAIGAPTENGRQSAGVSEMQELAGTRYYNPNWGFQNGEKRNASVGKTFQPILILSHDLRLNNNTSVLTGLSYTTGERSVSGLDWYNAPDPRPDYYRYLPSYQTDPALKQQVADYLSNNEAARQINWARLYDVNRNNTATIQNADGIQGNNVTGKRSLYIIQERVTKTQRINFNSVLNTRINEHIDFTGGISYQAMKNTYFQRVNDLLGGEFYVDLNQFAERTFPNDPNANQNDVNRPNRILKKDDEYGYNYDININKAAAWAQGVFKFENVDFFATAEVSQNKFWRTGNVKNGLFPDNSFGKGTVQNFTNYAFKAGVTYKINGRNYLYMNAAYITRPPFFENSYISARTRDAEQDGLTDEKIKTVEGGYILNAPKIKLRIGGYYTMFEDGFNVLTFYHETYRNFVNYAISNIDKLHFGGEFGFEAKVARNITVTGAAAIGRYYYNSRQNATITLDNTAQVLDSQVVYSQNYRVAGTPQEAVSLGFSYRSPKFWFVSLTANYFDQAWLDFNPVRRTKPAVDGVEPKSSQWHSIIDQTRFDAQMTVDFFGGYSWKLPHQINKARPSYLVINAGISNLLNNKEIITGGYEQLRFDFDTKDPNQFPPKLFSAYGINYFINLTLRF